MRLVRTDGVVAKLQIDLVFPVIGPWSKSSGFGLQTADCVVRGFRNESDSNKVGSLLLGLFEHVFPSISDSKDKRLDLVDRTDLAGLPPATVILAQIDPLRSEGEIYAQKLNEDRG